ncbi:hypothetical protein C0J52_20706, partial [Blattella germanica]
VTSIDKIDIVPWFGVAFNNCCTYCGKGQLPLIQVRPNRPKSSVNSYSADLCKALVCSNIPWNKLNNSVLRSFLENYCCYQNIPDE